MNSNSVWPRAISRQPSLVIEDMHEVIQSRRRHRYFPVNSGCMKFVFVASLPSALMRDF